MKFRFRVAVWLAAAFLLSAVRTSAETLWADDFQSYAATSSWLDTASDVDPGGDWVVSEKSTQQWAVQVHRSIVADVSGGANGPPINRAADDQFLNFAVGSNSSATAGLPSAAQTRMDELDNAQLGFQYHNAVGTGWSNKMTIAGYDDVPLGWKRVCFDIQFRPDGTVHYYNSSSSAYVELLTLSAVYNVNTWHQIGVDVNFGTDTYSLSVDSTTVGGLSCVSDVDKIQSVTYYQHTGSGRSAIDDVEVTAVPEPSSTFLLGIAMLTGLGLRRRHRV